MKIVSTITIQVFFIIGSILILSSCEKGSLLPIPIYEAGDQVYGFASGKKQTWDWEASGAGAKYTDDYGKTFWGVSMATYSKDGFIRESLRLDFIPFQKGEYDITHNFKESLLSSTYGTFRDDGDVLEDFYLVDETALTNKAQITRIDTTTNIIEGLFTVTMKIKDPEQKVNAINPDRVTFSDVSFSVQILP